MTIEKDSDDEVPGKLVWKLFSEDGLTPIVQLDEYGHLLMKCPECSKDHIGPGLNILEELIFLKKKVHRLEKEIKKYE